MCNNFKSILKEENYYLFKENHNNLIKICDYINNIIKVESNPGRFIMMETFIPKQIDKIVFVFENIKSKMDELYKYDTPKAVLNVRSYIRELISLSKELRNFISEDNTMLIIKYNKLLINKLNF